MRAHAFWCVRILIFAPIVCLVLSTICRAEDMLDAGIITAEEMQRNSHQFLQEQERDMQEIASYTHLAYCSATKNKRMMLVSLHNKDFQSGFYGVYATSEGGYSGVYHQGHFISREVLNKLMEKIQMAGINNQCIQDFLKAAKKSAPSLHKIK